MAFRLLAFGLVALVACGGRPRLALDRGAQAPEELWVIARGAGVRQAPAPVLAGRPAGSTTAPAPLHLARTEVAVAVVGPLVCSTRRQRYTVPETPTDAFVLLTADASPAREDFVVRAGMRVARVSVRAPDEAEALYQEARRAGRPATLFPTDAAGRVLVAVAAVVAGSTAELSVETVSIADWRDSAYEITVPGVPDDDGALTIDLYGTGPLVVVSSPSHVIDTEATALDRIRVRPREHDALRDDFVLRYRAEATGALLVRPEGSGALVGLLLHPQERDHEPVAFANVAIDWGAMRVTDVRPAAVGTLAAGKPLVVLARVQGPTDGPVTVTGRAGTSPRTFAIEVVANPPAGGLRALPILWARTADLQRVARR